MVTPVPRQPQGNYPGAQLCNFDCCLKRLDRLGLVISRHSFVERQHGGDADSARPILPRSSGAAEVALSTTPLCQAFTLNTKLVAKTTGQAWSCYFPPKSWQLFSGIRFGANSPILGGKPQDKPDPRML